jgi:ketosteroid isomerase-like protein
MGVTENKEIVRFFYEAGNRGDFEACFDLIADDITWTNIGSTRLSGTYRGKAELMEQLLGPLFGQLEAGISSKVDTLIGEGDLVVALTSGTAMTKDGRPYNNTYCQVIRIRDGKFVEVREYFDTALTGSIFGFSADPA